MPPIRTLTEAIEHQKKHGFPSVFGGYPAIVEAKPKRKGNRKLKQHREPNQTERDFGLYILEPQLQRGDIVHYGFEEITLRWADLEYTPDYFVIRHTRFFETVRTPSDSKEPEIVSDTSRRLIEAVYIELKGAHKWEDSIVKFKTARERFDWAIFEMWSRRGRGQDWEKLA